MTVPNYTDAELFALKYRRALMERDGFHPKEDPLAVPRLLDDLIAARSDIAVLSSELAEARRQWRNYENAARDITIKLDKFRAAQHRAAKHHEDIIYETIAEISKLANQSPTPNDNESGS